MLVKLRPEIRRTTADFTSKLNYEVERNASFTSNLLTSPVKRNPRGRLSPNTVQCFLEATMSRQIRPQQSFSTDVRLGIRMAGIPGKPSMLFKGFIPSKLFMTPLGHTS